MPEGFKKLISNQKGGVSIYVSMAIMAVLMLITLTFATVMAQNYEQTADSQLNTQAFYAAETGIADARARLLGLLDAYGRGDSGDLPAELLEIDDSSAGTGLADALSNIAPPSDWRAIDINADGNRIIFISDSADPLNIPHEPKIYVFNEVAGVWNSYSVPNSYASNVTANFGQEIVLNGDCLYVSDWQTANGGTIYSYDVSNPTTYSAVSTYSASSVNANLGFSFAVSANGQWLAAGSPGANIGGEVNIVGITAGCNIASSGTIRTIANPNLVAGERFGEEVTFSGNDRIAIGAPQTDSGDGAVYVYDDITTTPPDLVGTIKGQIGLGEQIGKVLSLEGDTLVIGVPGPGSSTVYVYKYDFRAGWEKNSTLTGAGEFGASVDIENGFLVIGAPSGNKVYVHQYKDGNWEAKVETLTGSNQFGQPVILRGRSLTVGRAGSGQFRFTIDATADLDIGELIERLAAACVNKKGDGSDFYNFDLVNEDEIYYSCLDIDLAPEILYYSKIEQDRSLGILLKSIEPPTPTPPDSYGDRDLESLVIQWVNSGATSPTSFDTSLVVGNSLTDPKFPPYSDWTYDAPVLEVQITAMNRDQGYTRQDLINHTKVAYLYPSTDPNPATKENQKNWGDIESGAIIKASCNSYLDEDETTVLTATGNCTVVLKDLMEDIYPDPHNNHDRIIFYLRVRSLYDAANLTIRGYSYQYISPPADSSGRNNNLKDLVDRRVRFRDIQAVIGATGHSGDVQVRLEERFRLQPVYDYPEHGINSAQTVCKIFISDQDTGTDVHDVTLADPPTGIDVQQECQPF